MSSDNGFEGLAGVLCIGRIFYVKINGASSAK
jgi:hypothetical protein